MALQRIDRTTPLDACTGIYNEWLEFLAELLQAYPNNPGAVSINFTRAYYAAYHGVMLTERAAEAIVEQEQAAMPRCPYLADCDFERWSIWQQLHWAKEIGHTAAIRELSYELTRLNAHGSITPTSTRTASMRHPSAPQAPERVRRTGDPPRFRREQWPHKN
jgi:hypothetical protein